MSIKDNTLLGNYEELIKQLKQAQGVLCSICTEDQFTVVDTETLSNVLWSISDNVDNAIESSHLMIKCSDDIQVINKVL